MKIRLLNYLSVAATILFSLYSCHLEKETETVPTKSLSITIDEAKTWYEASSSSRARIASKKQNQLAYWKYAQEGKLANGVDIVSVPLLYNSNTPISVPSDENFTRKDSIYSLPSFDRAGHQIQQKLLISKDENGKLRSVTITIIPERNDQRKKKAAKKADFSGVVLLMNEAGDNFKIGWRYKKGKVTDMFGPPTQSANGRLASYSCKVGFYQLMAQNPHGSSGYNCDPFARACLPDAFLDQDTGGFWVKIAEFDATCDDGIPNSGPIRENPWDAESSWVAVNPSGGSGGPVIKDPFNTNNETSPIDYGMPFDLSPIDAFTWEMANRIGPHVYLANAEIEFLTENWDFTYDFREYVGLNNIKPDLGTNLNGWFYDENNYLSNKIEVKVVGRDSYNEETDYRLYRTDCEAYTFLFNKAVSSNDEYGAYITTKGIIVLPANKARTTPTGGRAIEFLTWKMSKSSNKDIVPTNEGTFVVRGYIHTHPSPPGIASPSTADQQFAGRHTGTSHYVMNTFVINQFFSNGSTQPYAGVFEKRCP